MNSWHGEHGTDPLAFLVHEAMRRHPGAVAGSWVADRGTLVRLEAPLTEEPANPERLGERGKGLA